MINYVRQWPSHWGVPRSFLYVQIPATVASDHSLRPRKKRRGIGSFLPERPNLTKLETNTNELAGIIGIIVRVGCNEDITCLFLFGERISTILSVS